MRLTTGEQLREMAKLLPRYEVTTENADVFRARIAELEAELAALKAKAAELEGLLLEALAYVDVCCWEGKLGSHKLRCRIGEFLSKKELSE